MAPCVSHIIIFLIPIAINNSVIEIPAAPPPLTINLTSPGYFFINFKELINAAAQTIAVPC
jgi:hypothetical protein